MFSRAGRLGLKAVRLRFAANSDVKIRGDLINIIA